MKDYSRNLIKDYKYWQLFVAENQGYLGRCYVWCKRENALDMTDATVEEQQELFEILKEVKGVLEKTFNIDWLNFAFLGNEDQHLHGHIIPRYASPREFLGMTFTDEFWGKNYRTNKKFITPREVVDAVKLKIKELL